ncbi:MAG: ABC transporter permease [Sedimentisphaerales bacterium]|nr:ABC transporter permease [Sedimentisphaerales bacterium]
MRKIYNVAQREYRETVRTWTFILGLVLLPAILGGLIVFGDRLAPDRNAPRAPIRVGVTTPSSELFGKIQAAFGEYNKSHQQAPMALTAVDGNPESSLERGKDMLRQARLDAYVELQGNLEDTEGTARFYTYKPKSSQIDALFVVEGLVRDAVINRRYEKRGLDRATFRAISSVPIQRIELGEEQGQEQMQGEGQRVARMMVPFAFMYLIFIGIIGMGQHLVSSIIEEKNSRIIEVLLSVVSPFDLMAGKITGLAAVGCTTVAVWGIVGYAAAMWQGVKIDVGAGLIAYGLIYYILGFILFSAILAGVGSVCNTIKETQSLLMPVMLVFVVPVIAGMKLVQDPNGELARVLSYVPPTTPMVMVLRLSSGSDIWIGEVILSILALSAGALATVWAAARVFRTGILLYGKRPALREILRWLKEK